MVELQRCTFIYILLLSLPVSGFVVRPEVWSSNTDVLAFGVPASRLSATLRRTNDPKLQNRGNSVRANMLSVDAAMMGVSSDLMHTVTSAYTACLSEYPLVTKSITASLLCGVSDWIAQKRDLTRKEINWGRLSRFALKGLGGGVIWTFWYDVADTLAEEILLPFGGIPLTGAAKVIASIFLEQFFWCPLVFGLWEIPMATILNGAQVNKIPVEVQSKLPGLLVANAKVWTPANMLIYNVPLEYRVGLGSLVDVLWQSIVAEATAECGSETGDVCVTDEGFEPSAVFAAEAIMAEAFQAEFESQNLANEQAESFAAQNAVSAMQSETSLA